jgi:dipeptidase E
VSEPCIVALGGGGLAGEEDGLRRFILELSGVERPRACYLPTAGGDAAEWIQLVRERVAGIAELSVLTLFRREVSDIAELLLSQDVIYVGGGNTANMLAIWRLHGVDAVLREAWSRGIVLAGVSAGANCWFEACSTDSFGPDLAPLNDGLGFLTGSFCPHYDGEPLRKPTYQRWVAEGALPSGYAADDGVGLVFRGTELAEAVSEVPGGRAFRVAPSGPQALAVRRL